MIQSKNSELSKAKLWLLIKELQELNKYFPDLKENELPERKYTWTIIFNLKQDIVKSMLLEARLRRSINSKEKSDFVIKIQQSSYDLKLINLENKAYKRWQISSIHADFLKVIQKSRINDELVHGLNKIIKALDRKEAQLNI